MSGWKSHKIQSEWEKLYQTKRRQCEECVVILQNNFTNIEGPNNSIYENTPMAK